MSNSGEHIRRLVDFLVMKEIEYSTSEHRPELLFDANLCCYDKSFSSQLAIFPDNKQQVSSIMKYINDTESSNSVLKVFPVSTGNNWGYGSATPSSEAAVLLCLKKLNRRPQWASNSLDTSTPYGKKLGIVKIDAGVTQKQLYEFLVEEGGEFWMDATGSSPNASVLGNTVTRGFGHTPYGDHFGHCSGMEVVLADGTIVKTGHSGHINAASSGVHKHGLGPVVEGLFSQSNLGIVTSIYLELMPAKQFLKKFFIKVESTEEFLETVERLKELKLKGTLNSQIHCGNTHKGIQAMMRFPFRDLETSTHLPTDKFNELKTSLGISAWTISGAIYADSKLELSAKTKLLKLSLNGVSHKLILITPALSNMLHKILSSKLLSSFNIAKIASLQKQAAILSHLIGLKQGKPTSFFLNSVYYRKRNTQKTQAPHEPCPPKDKVGLMWVAPIGPMTRETVRKMIEIATSVSQAHGFDPALSITLLNERAADCVISIVFDRECAEEDARALLCYDNMLTDFNNIGLTSYRSAIRGMQTDSLGMSHEQKKLLKNLKVGLDPKNIIAPGHYIPF